MGLLEDIMLTLERIPIWKRVKALPDEIDALKARIAALEQQIAGGSGQRCPVCNSPGFKCVSSAPHSIFGSIGGIQSDTYQCPNPACKHSETRQRKSGD